MFDRCTAWPKGTTTEIGTALVSDSAVSDFVGGVSTVADAIEVADVAMVFRGAVLSLDVSVLSDDELLDLVPLLERVRRAADAALGSSLGELDVRGTTDERFGHRTAQWFAITVNCSIGEAKKRVQVGRRMRRLEFVSGAFADGSVSFEHTRVVSDLATPRNAAIIEGLQIDLVRLAGVLPFERWRAEAKGLVDLADGDGSFRPGPESSTLRMTTGFGGSVELAGTLTALDGAALREAVEAEADRLRLRYRDEQRTGSTDMVPTRAELLAEALATLVRQGLVAGRGGKGAVTELTLVAHAADPLGGSELPESAIRTLCCDPVIRTVVLDSLGNPVDLGRTARVVPKGLRRALEVRDGGCVFPDCDAPSSWCDLHHVVHWADGGPTSADNLASLCRHHHGVTHRSGWEMTSDPHREQRFIWTRPDGATLWSQRAGDVDAAVAIGGAIERRTGPPRE